jgi:hypothetical protein
MSNLYETLIETLLTILADSGFKIPGGMTQKRREEFIFNALESVAIVPRDRYTRILDAGQAVVRLWTTGELPQAVRNLDAALKGQENERLYRQGT